MSQQCAVLLRLPPCSCARPRWRELQAAHQQQALQAGVRQRGEVRRRRHQLLP
jgi:hypothetical protein